MTEPISTVAVWKEDSLALGNRWLQRRWTASVDETLRTSAFLNRQTGRNYARWPCREFSFSANGQSVTTEDFVLSAIDVRPGDPARAVARLRGQVLPLEVEIHLEVYADHPVLRKWMVLRNRGAQTVTLRELNWEDIGLLVDTAATAEVWSDYLTQRAKSVVVSMDDGVLLVNDPLHREGFIVASEAPGPLKRMEAYAEPGRIAVGYNRDDETVFERLLRPGEEFTTAASFLLPFARPIPQDAVDNEYARFVGERLTLCDVAQVPSIVVNSWIPFLFDIRRDLLLDQIDRAADLGVDAYQVDAGWYDYMGDWNADPEKFPNGLEEVADHARKRGMRFGLWMAAATVDEESQVLKEHPEWVARDRNGEPNRHPIDGAITMCLDSGYFDWIRDKMDMAIGRYGVELFKMDLSTVRNLYAPGAYPGCYAQNHMHRSHDESHLRILERLFALIRDLKRAHPRCLFDLSYECYGIMDGTDLALTQVADQNWFSNIYSPNDVDLRREIYQRGRVTRPWTLNYGATLLEQPEAPHYGLFTALSGHGVFWGDLAEISPEMKTHYQRWFKWVKEQRACSDFYRYYKVSDVFAVPDGISSRDYRHAIPVQRYGIRPLGIHPAGFDPGSTHPGEFWDGAARLDERGEGPIFLFRPAAAPTAFYQLRIPWVDPAVGYRVTDLMEDREVGVFGGQELMDQGIEIHIAEPAQAKIIVLRRT